MPLTFDGLPRKKQDSYSILYQALCIISKPLVNSNWSYSLLKLNSGEKLAICSPVRPLNLTIAIQNRQGTCSLLHQALCIISEPLVNSNLSYCPKTLYLCQNRQFFDLCDLEIYKMTLKNSRALLLFFFKLCASFLSHLWIQTGVTVQKRPNWDKICFDLCDLDLWPLTWTFSMDITFINSNNSWKFDDDTMTGTL